MSAFDAVKSWHLVDAVALPRDVEAEIEETALDAVSRGVPTPTPTGTVAWSAARVPSEHPVVQGAGLGVVGATTAEGRATVWEPEFG